MKYYLDYNFKINGIDNCYDCICERKIPHGLLKKYIIRKDNIYKYDVYKSYINTYFFDSPINL